MNFSRTKLLYNLIRKNQKLAVRRHPMLDQNKAMKIFIYIMAAFWAAYLMFFGIMFGSIDFGAFENFDMIDGGMIWFLVLDFYLRFTMQETPAQEIKPYKLLPIKQNFLLNVFLIRLGLRGYNLFWFFFLLPFGILAIVKFYGLLGLLGWLFGWWLLFVFNSYWYLIFRTLNQRSWLYLLIPTAVYAAVIYFGMFHDSGNQWLFDGCVQLGRAFCTWNWWSYLCIFAVIVVLFFINQRMQRACVYREIAQVEHVEKVKSTEMSFLNRFGIIGEFMKLEIKSTMRNKVVRKQFLTGAICTLVFCLLFAFTDVYDDMTFMRTYICVYCFACLGTITLTNVMCMEGNYIDFLMSRKESVLQLLKAKYYFNCLMLLFPLLFSIAPIVQGKILFIEALGCMFFTSGAIFPFLFQLAVYNNQTLQLNVQITKSGRSTKHQMIFSLAALLVPMLIMYILIVVFNVEVASWVMLVIGLLGTGLSHVWLRNIYHRFMIRRYDNMAGFRDSLNHD